MNQDIKRCSLVPAEHLPRSYVHYVSGIKKGMLKTILLLNYLWNKLEFLCHGTSRNISWNVSLKSTYALAQTIVNPPALGDEYTWRWCIKSAITRTPSKAKNQLERIVKLGPLKINEQFMSLITASVIPLNVRASRHALRYFVHIRPQIRRKPPNRVT